MYWSYLRLLVYSEYIVEICLRIFVHEKNVGFVFNDKPYTNNFVKTFQRHIK